MNQRDLYLLVPLWKVDIFLIFNAHLVSVFNKGSYRFRYQV